MYSEDKNMLHTQAHRKKRRKNREKKRNDRYETILESVELRTVSSLQQIDVRSLFEDSIQHVC